MYFSRTAVLLAALTLVSANTLVEEKNGVVSDSDASPTMKRYLKGRNPVRSLSLFIYIYGLLESRVNESVCFVFIREVKRRVQV